VPSSVRCKHREQFSFRAYSLQLTAYFICILIIAGCVTTPRQTVNMGDPATYVKVNFLKENYDEVIRYSRTLGVLNNQNNRLTILYYVGLSQLEKQNYRGARESFKLLKSRDTTKQFQDVADIRIADSYFLEQKYHQAARLYEPLVSRYPKSTYLPYIYYRLVLTSQKTSDFKEAKRYFGQLQRKYPESLEALRLSSVLDSMDLEGYSVQVGAFSDKTKAYKMQGRLLNRGYIASVRRATRDSVTFYRVRINCDSRSEAERIAGRLRLEGYATKVFP